MIPYGKQSISQADIDSVVEVLHSDYLTQGPQVPLFEASVANYCSADYAVAVNSATSALHIACLALGLSEGDVLWTSPNTFVASANCALYCGADVDFVDINLDLYTMCVHALAQKLKEAKARGCLPKIVIPVHFAGQSCDMKRIHALSLEYGFSIIEDAAHAIGGQYRGSPIGGCQFSDITVFSFHPVKIITTAEGGLATTNQPGLAEKMQLLRSHGVTRDAQLMSEAEGPWVYQQVDLGFNYRMTEVQAALGVSQMMRLNEFIEKRTFFAKRYDDLLQGLPLKLPMQHSETESAFHLYPILIQPELVTLSRAGVFKQLRDRGVGVNVHYIPVHTQPYYQQRGFAEGDFPNAESYYHQTISIPVFHAMTIEDQDQVISVLKQILQ
ncbi:MAG: UDP-4-amino-4,6-dideoxy-N-acetyl-beta-L-altrosamine transaminase [Gammaproteobacteria bacterium]|nr:UDP-4-amino-4,6-dideoxy-N-acetyl-beta-L-altrosamine transaminase [Gammaproteobacteria bacterium]